MIVIGDASLTKQIRELWRNSFVDPTGRYIDFFFRSIYKPEYAYNLVEDGQLQASILRIPHAVMFNERVLALPPPKRPCCPCWLLPLQARSTCVSPAS